MILIKILTIYILLTIVTKVYVE